MREDTQSYTLTHNTLWKHTQLCIAKLELLEKIYISKENSMILFHLNSFFFFLLPCFSLEGLKDGLWHEQSFIPLFYLIKNLSWLDPPFFPQCISPFRFPLTPTCCLSFHFLPEDFFVSFSGMLKYDASERLRMFFCALYSFVSPWIRPSLSQVCGILYWLLMKSSVLWLFLNTTRFRMLSRWSEWLCGPDVMKAEWSVWQIANGEESFHAGSPSQLTSHMPVISTPVCDLYCMRTHRY